MLETREIDPYLFGQYLEEISEMESGLLAGISGLELVLADPNNLTIFDRLVQERFNLEAFNDIFITSYNLKQIPPNLRLDKRDYIVVDGETGATGIPGVYAGGDIVRGAAIVIFAIGDGRKASAVMHRYLIGDGAEGKAGLEEEQ
jgi:hypothetical protein